MTGHLPHRVCLAFWHHPANALPVILVAQRYSDGDIPIEPFNLKEERETGIGYVP